MIEGNIPTNQKYYVLRDLKDDQKVTGNNVKIISPTQSSVDRAKNEVIDAKSINSGVDGFINQMGGSSKKRRKSSKKSGVKKSPQKVTKKRIKQLNRKNQNREKI